MADPVAVPTGVYSSVAKTSEKRAGIRHYTSPIDFGWYGDIRRRYTDFIVHEVGRDGNVVYLTDDGARPEPEAPKEHLKAPAPAPVPTDATTHSSEGQGLTPTDTDALVSLVGPDVAKQMQDAHAAIVNGGPTPARFTVAVCADRSKRGNYHKEIRRIFGGTFETKGDPDTGAIFAWPAGSLSAQELASLAPPIDVEGLVALVGPDVAQQLQDAYTAIVSGGQAPTNLTVAICNDRSQRGRYHQEIRRIFRGRFETRADGDSGEIIAMPSAGTSRPRTRGRNASAAKGRDGGRDGRDGQDGHDDRDGRRRNAGKPELEKGKYVHFTMYKENKDTMEAVAFLGRQMKVKLSSFGFAGTKDRRAATTQRVSVWYNGHENLGWINQKSKFVKVGDFGRSKQPLQLGQHGGNDFVIVVKGVELLRGSDCSLRGRLRMTEACVQAALDHVLQHGFINYFGPQRFGTRAIGTQDIGIKILSGDFKGACDAILHVEPDLVAALGRPNPEHHYHTDEISRARAILQFRDTGTAGAALEIMPRRFSAESTIIQHLGRDISCRTDYCGALCRITRGLRILYIHAYQSLVWNWATSERWSRYGDKVIAGDLVLVESEANPARLRQDPENSGMGGSGDLPLDEEQFYQEARVLSADEAASGQYTVFDIVLPVPGFDVLYPDNDIGEFYTNFMARPENGSLDPYNMRRPQKEFSLSGHYRKIMARFTAVPQFFVRPYASDTEQMHPTDLDDLVAANDEKKRQAAQVQGAVHGEGGANDASDGSGIGHRRRRHSSTQPLDNANGQRDNDAWVENPSMGGSKRVKIGAAPEESYNGTAGFTAAANLEELGGHGHGLPTAQDVAQAFDLGGSPPGSPIIVASTPSLGSAPRPPRAPPASTLVSTQHIKNVFRSSGPQAGLDGNTAASISQDPASIAGAKAINRTAAWRSSAPELAEAENMEIAVVLNFRLPTSNYATMCLREMMSSAIHPLREGTGERNGERAGRGAEAAPAARTVPSVAQQETSAPA